MAKEIFDWRQQKLPTAASKLWRTKRSSIIASDGSMVFAVLFWLFGNFGSQQQTTWAYPSRIPIQSFTMASDQGLSMTLNYTVNRLNSAMPNTFLLAHRNKELRISSDDSWGLMNKICEELQLGFMSMVSGETRMRAHEAYASVADTLEVPLLNWDLSPIYFSTGAKNHFEVSIRPPSAELLADLIIMKGWASFVYLTDADIADQSSQNLRMIFERLYSRLNESNVTAEMYQLPKEVSEFGEFLMRFNIRRFGNREPSRVILDLSSSYRQQQFLKAIRSAQFNQMNYHYVLANFDLSPYDIEMFQNGNINITGFQILDRESREYSILMRSIELAKYEGYFEDHVDLETRFALVHDALIVAKAAFDEVLKGNESLFRKNFRHGELYNRDFPGIHCWPERDRNNPSRPFSTFEHGRTIIKAIKSLKLSGKDGTLTGNIEFDQQGVRKNFVVNVIELASDMKSALNKKEVFSWRQSSGFIASRTMAQHTRKQQKEDTRRKVVRVVTIFVEPFVMIRRECEQNPNASECQGNDRYEGYCIDLLKLLAERIDDFNYEVFISSRYGSKQPDGSWDGLIGYLLRGEADVSVASLTINQDRERVVDFSKPYMTTGISIMIKKPDKQEFSVFSFMQPLSREIWMYITFAYIGVSIVIFLVSRFSPYEWRVEEMASGNFTISNDFSIYNCLWFTLAAFMQQGTDILPRSISGRVASSAWWFFTMIIVSSYTANLAAFLTLEKMQAPIESVEDLAKQTKIKYGIQQGGSTAQFFKHSSVQIYQRMWRFMDSQGPSVFVNNYTEGINKVRSQKGRYAFLLEATANEYANTRKPCDTMKVGGSNLNSVGYGVATPFGSKWKDAINLAILALQERGELKKLENKWWYDRGECDQGISDGASASLNLSKVAGIFYILMGGMIISMIAALCEFFYRLRIEARKGQVPVKNFGETIRDSFCSQIKLSLQGRAEMKDGMNTRGSVKMSKGGPTSLHPITAGYGETPPINRDRYQNQRQNSMNHYSSGVPQHRLNKGSISPAGLTPPSPRNKYNTTV